MSSFENKNVLITGGANGLGRLMGLKALREGAKCLIVWDIDAEAMEKLSRECNNKGWKCITCQVDLSKGEQIRQTAKKVKDEIRTIDMLFNNAGIIVGKSFINHSKKEIRQTLAINVEAVMLVTKEFLPGMLEQNSGHIITISSASSLIGNPNMSVYAASKWAVTGWSESLRLELKKSDSNVKVTTVQPGYIDTGMFAGVEPPLLTPLLKPGEIAEKIIRAVKKDKTLLREPFMVKITPFLMGLLPAKVFDLVAGQFFKVYSSMDNFKSRGSNE